jgi:hypothetical protein
VRPPRNDDARRQPGVRGTKQGSSESPNCAADERDRKRFATVVARAALIGLEVHHGPGGFTFTYHAFGPVEGYVCTVSNLARAEEMVCQLERDYCDAMQLVQRVRGKQ